MISQLHDDPQKAKTLYSPVVDALTDESRDIGILDLGAGVSGQWLNWMADMDVIDTLPQKRAASAPGMGSEFLRL